MTEDEYVTLLAATRDELCSVEFLACPALHPTRQAVALRARLGLIATAPATPTGFRARLRLTAPWLVLFVYCARRALTLLVVRMAAWAVGVRQHTPVDLVMRSWAVASVVAAVPRDFYFGGLQDSLAAEGVRVVRLLRRVGRSSQLKATLQLLRMRRGDVLPEDLFVSPLEPIRILLRLAAARLRLRRGSEPAAGTPAAIVRAAVRNDLSSVETAVALEIYAASRAAAHRLRPRAYVTFYEGFSWEPCAWRGIDEAGVDTTIVGFNHTVICVANYAMRHPRRSAWYRSVPDHVFCAGEVQRELVAASHHGLGVPVETLGSPRVLSAPSPPALSPTHDVIVIPEGLIDEIRTFFVFIAETNAIAPQLKFLVRLHPVLPFDRLPADVQGLVAGRANVELSQDTDFTTAVRRCRFALYSGSSAVLEAMTHRVLPLYLPGEENLDPLVEGTGVRVACRNAAELLWAIRAFEQRRPAEQLEMRDRAAAAAARYAVAFRPQVLRALVTA